MLYDRILLFIHPVCNSLHRLVPNSQSICCLINSMTFTRQLILLASSSDSSSLSFLQPICGIEGTGAVMWILKQMSRQVKWPPAYTQWFINQLQSLLGAGSLSLGLYSFSITRGSVLLSCSKEDATGDTALSCSWKSIVTWQAGLPGGPLFSFLEGWGLIFFFFPKRK